MLDDRFAFRSNTNFNFPNALTREIILDKSRNRFKPKYNSQIGRSNFGGGIKSITRFAAKRHGRFTGVDGHEVSPAGIFLAQSEDNSPGLSSAHGGRAEWESEPTKSSFGGSGRLDRT